MKKQINTNVPFWDRSIHPDSYKAIEYPFPDYKKQDSYERKRNYYLKLKTYENALDKLGLDCWIPIDRACEQRKKERWQIASDIEKGLETDPVLIAGWLASRVLSMDKIQAGRQADELLFKIDAGFPAEAKVSRLYGEEDRYSYYYVVPIPVSMQIQERILKTSNAPDVAITDGTVKVRFGPKQEGWMNQGEWLMRIVYQAVYIDGFNQIQPIIEQFKSF